jgi:hypothetical protein
MHQKFYHLVLREDAKDTTFLFIFLNAPKKRNNYFFFKTGTKIRLTIGGGGESVSYKNSRRCANVKIQVHIFVQKADRL